MTFLILKQRSAFVNDLVVFHVIPECAQLDILEVVISATEHISHLAFLWLLVVLEEQPLFIVFKYLLLIPDQVINIIHKRPLNNGLFSFTIKLFLLHQSCTGWLNIIYFSQEALSFNARLPVFLLFFDAASIPNIVLAVRSKVLSAGSIEARHAVWIQFRGQSLPLSLDQLSEKLVMA